MKSYSRPVPVLLAALALSTGLSAAPADSSELQELREQLAALEHKLLVLERKQELQDDKVEVAVTDKGVTLTSADNANSPRIRGLAQLDSRLFFNDGGGVVNNAFVLRRARIITEGTFAKDCSFQFVPEFGGSSVSIVDANFSVTLDLALTFKFGKFKSPVGLELLQSDSWTFFNERSIVTNLVPNRDLGVQASGDVLNGTLNYIVAVLGGVGDGGSTNNADFDNEKDVVARLFVSPFKHDAGSFLQGLSFGISGSAGREKTTAGRTSGYKTDGQQTFLAFNAATIADGQTWRVSPQVDYRHGSFGAMGEYVVSAVNVRPSPTGLKTELQNKAWQIAAGYVLTGEDSSFTGVSPKTNLDFAAGTWGAFEVTARYANLKVDDAAFPLYASAASNANEATSFGAGLNWYLSKTVAFKFDYYRTNFGFNAVTPAFPSTQILRQDEQVFISRFQLSF